MYVRTDAHLFLNVPMYDCTDAHLFLNVPMYDRTDAHLFLNVPMFDRTDAHLFLNVPMYDCTDAHLFLNVSMFLALNMPLLINIRKLLKEKEGFFKYLAWTTKLKNESMKKPGLIIIAIKCLKSNTRAHNPIDVHIAIFHITKILFFI